MGGGYEYNGERFREELAELASIERPSASPGERLAAEWLKERLREAGAPARIETERALGSYWWPLGLASAAAALAGAAALRSRGRAGRFAAAAVAAVAAAGIADDFPPSPRRSLRRGLPKRETFNVVADLGPQDAERTIVVVAHHDAAHSGLIFSPALPETIHRFFPSFFEDNDTSPAMMWPAVGAPAAVALGSLLGSRALIGLGAAVSAGYAAAMADIGSRAVVPGANDNATAVVLLLALARALAESPTESTRVWLVSTGSEESFSEGMKAFGERHFGELPRESTFFLCVDTVGSPHLNVLRGEGFMRMNEYPADALALIDGLAEELGIWLFPDLRLRNGTDGLEALAAGYPTVTMCSVTELKTPANYHWPTDTAENVDYETLADAVRLSEALIRRLDERWLS
ncbi:MAG: M28 family peptidase [Solirubrobacterales bacterium]|nr:M28 family peptidase [Solirubrobacterales bacterium]